MRKLLALIRMPSAVAAVLSMIVFVGLILKDMHEVAAGIWIGGTVSLLLFIGLRWSITEMAHGTVSTVRLKMIMAGRLLLVAIVLIVVGLAIPRALWGFMISFSVFFLAFFVEMLSSRPKGSG